MSHRLMSVLWEMNHGWCNFLQSSQCQYITSYLYNSLLSLEACGPLLTCPSFITSTSSIIPLNSLCCFSFSATRLQCKPQVWLPRITVNLVIVYHTGSQFTTLPPVNLLPEVRVDCLFHEMIKARMKPYTSMHGKKVRLTPDLTAVSPGSASQTAKMNIIPVWPRQLWGCLASACILMIAHLFIHKTVQVIKNLWPQNQWFTWGQTFPERIRIF